MFITCVHSTYLICNYCQLPPHSLEKGSGTVSILCYEDADEPQDTLGGAFSIMNCRTLLRASKHLQWEPKWQVIANESHILINT